jgi:transcriptional regulator with PAS, ATPase and Fis domain
LVANAVHRMSNRKENRIVPVNCGAISEHLLESEFFGYKKGAFTGANADKQGFLDFANEGTLFLDELGELNLNIQAKLLRAIDGGGYTPVGSTVVKNADFRIIAATNRDLQKHVIKGLMREDFFYRIHVIPIHLPPLRERKEDIPLLIDHFLKANNYKKKVPAITGKTLEQLLNYSWPGNVRELENTLHRFVTIGKLDFLGEPMSYQISRKDLVLEAIKKETLGLQEATAHFEKMYIHNVLEQNKWHRKNVASILKISRRTLYDKMKNYRIMEFDKDKNPAATN